MDRDIYRSPATRSGYTGDQAEKSEEPVAPINVKSASAEVNRGKRAPRNGTGAVTGSGAGAGGGGGREDYDDDPQAGGGTLDAATHDPAPGTGADAPVGGSR